MKIAMLNVKPAVFVLLAALSVNALAKDDKPQAKPAPTAATDKPAVTKAESKPVLRIGGRMQLQPVPASAFRLGPRK